MVWSRSHNAYTHQVIFTDFERKYVIIALLLILIKSNLTKLSLFRMGQKYLPLKVLEGL